MLHSKKQCFSTLLYNVSKDNVNTLYHNVSYIVFNVRNIIFLMYNNLGYIAFSMYLEAM